MCQKQVASPHFSLDVTFLKEWELIIVTPNPSSVCMCVCACCSTPCQLFSHSFQTLERLCEDYDIEDILKITTEKVSLRSTPEGYKMCPNYRTNLAKRLRFRRSPSVAVRGKYSALAVQGR